VFQHIHLLSADPIAAAEWYAKEFGATPGFSSASNRERRVVNGLQVFPMTSVRIDNVNFIWFPKEFASQGVYKKQWEAGAISPLRAGASSIISRSA